ncbi:MAG: NAD-binding protein, partial [Burkholderiales bacterium]|nr:NAD-binding protein [Burkholderiales bacterium]
RMLSRNFQPGFKAALHAKDLNIVMQTAYHYGLALPQSALIAQHLNALVGGGDGEIDSAAVVKVIERSAGERITAPLASTEPVNADASVDGTAGARPTVGFIGLGAMGRPMALNLMKAGYELAVWSRRPESAQSVVDAGATRCDSPAEVARRSDVIFTMVMAGPDVESVVLGEQGIAEGAKPGSIVIDCSTIPPDTVRRIAARLRERQIEFIDAPVSGGEVGAAAGTLSIMAGGSKAAYERALPLLSTFGKTLIHVGETGSGQAAKAANQLVLVVSIHGIAEAMAFAAANDVPFEPVWTALMKGFAGSRMLEVFGPRMMNRQFEAGLDAALHHKDSHIVLECAAASKTPVPGLALAAQAFNALMGRPGTRWDSAALRLVVSDTQGRV